MADPLTIYAAITGTAGALAAAFTVYSGVFRDRAKVSVRLGREFYSNEQTDDSKSRPFALVSFDPSQWATSKELYPEAMTQAHIQVSNRGRRPVTIVQAGVEYADGTVLVFKPGTSARLDEGDFLSFRVTEAGLAQSLAQHGELPTHVSATDSSHKIHRSKIDEALEPWIRGLMTSQDGRIEAGLSAP